MELLGKNFREKMISDYYRKIIEKRTEVKLLEADIAGLFSKVAEEIESNISRFDGKALLTPKQKRVWRVIETKATPYSDSDFIMVTFSFAANPSQVVGKSPVTKKEKELIKKMQNLWDNGRLYCLRNDFVDLDKELKYLSHGYKCVCDSNFKYSINDFMNEKDILYAFYNFSNLEEGSSCSSSSLMDYKE
jgi:hypothetical protein